MDIIINKKELANQKLEVVERKGVGHPDTLSDALAEYLSSQYSKYTLKKFGAILHHNFDKAGLLGGASFVAFGKGYLTSPIRVLINGRVSTKFGEELIPIRKLLTRWIKNFFKGRLPNVDIDQDLELHFNLSNQSSPGKVYEENSVRNMRLFWFQPRSIADVGDLNNPRSNDTSIGVGYAPKSKLESLVLELESLLTVKLRKAHKWIGTDVKILAVRNNKDVNITMCIPQISTEVKDLGTYKENLEFAKSQIVSVIKKFGFSNFGLSINTRDKYETQELYLTATGSSIESGDEGLSGRGNRVNGIISQTRPMSIEGACGKNPVYHIGKLYYLAAFKIAEKIYKKFGVYNEVFIASQSGRPLIDPWFVGVNIDKDLNISINSIEAVVKNEIRKISSLTKLVINQEIHLY